MAAFSAGEEIGSNILAMLHGLKECVVVKRSAIEDRLVVIALALQRTVMERNM